MMLSITFYFIYKVIYKVYLVYSLRYEVGNIKYISTFLPFREDDRIPSIVKNKSKQKRKHRSILFCPVSIRSSSH